MEPTPYDSIVNQFPYGLCIVDEEGRVLGVNAALEQLLGWPATDWCGRSLSSYLEGAIPDPGQALAWTAALEQALAQGETTYLNLPADFRAGPGGADGLVPATGVVVPWQDGPERAGALIVFQDGTLAKDVQAVQARFLAVLAHELSAPVGNLGAAADLLAKRLGGDEHALRRLVQIVRREAGHLRRILAQLPATLPAHIEAPRLRQDVVTLRPILQRAVDTFSVRDPDCRLVVEVPPDLPFARGNAEQVQEVVEKLVENALYYARAGGRITLGARAEGDAVVLSVCGQGPEDAPQADGGLTARFTFRLLRAQNLPDEAEGAD